VHQGVGPEAQDHHLAPEGQHLLLLVLLLLGAACVPGQGAVVLPEGVQGPQQGLHHHLLLLLLLLLLGQAAACRVAHAAAAAAAAVQGCLGHLWQAQQLQPAAVATLPPAAAAALLVEQLAQLLVLLLLQQQQSVPRCWAQLPPLLPACPTHPPGSQR